MEALLEKWHTVFGNERKPDIVSIEMEVHDRMIDIKHLK